MRSAALLPIVVLYRVGPAQSVAVATYRSSRVHFLLRRRLTAMQRAGRRDLAEVPGPAERAFVARGAFARQAQRFSVRPL